MKARVFILAVMVAFVSFANAQQPMPRKHGNKIEFRVKRMADKLMLNPKLYSTFLLWLLSELYEKNEIYETSDMYPAFVKKAQEEGETVSGGYIG